MSTYNETHQKLMYEKYKEEGYYMPYNEPFDIEHYYANAEWVLILGHIVRSFIGFVWIFVLACSILTNLKVWQMMKQQQKYNQLVEKRDKELLLYEDAQVIKDVKESYKKKLQVLDDRIERYNISNFNDILRYFILMAILLITSLIWLKVDFLRQCLLDGLGLTGLVVFYFFIYHKVYKPIKSKIDLKLEIARLNKIINQEKKEK